MSKVFLGVDGGGTKTHACIVDLDGNILGTAANGGANWERSGIRSVQDGLNEIIEEALHSAGATREEIVDSTFALAGIDWEEDQKLFIPVVTALGPMVLGVYRLQALAERVQAAMAFELFKLWAWI